MAQRGRLFQGTELPRFLILSAILAIGWPVFLLYGGPSLDSSDDPQPSVSSIGDVPPLPPPDADEVLAAVQDKTPMGFRDNAAYALLLARVREQSAAELAANSRRDVMFTHLWQKPERYRGLPIHLDGTINRVLSYEVATTLAPGGRIYEAWAVTPDSTPNPFVLVFENPPAGLPGGTDLDERMSFNGYFFKLMSYKAADTFRHAPLLVGQLTRVPRPATFTGTYSRTTVLWSLLLVGVLTVIALLRLAFQTGKQQAKVHFREEELLSSAIGESPLPDHSPLTPAALAKVLEKAEVKAEAEAKAEEETGLSRPLKGSESD